MDNLIYLLNDFNNYPHYFYKIMFISCMLNALFDIIFYVIKIKYTLDNMNEKLNKLELLNFRMYLKIENLISNDLRIEFFKSESYKYYVWANKQAMLLKIPLVIIFIYSEKFESERAVINDIRLFDYQ
jgi:hypothetical protein